MTNLSIQREPTDANIFRTNTKPLRKHTIRFLLLSALCLLSAALAFHCRNGSSIIGPTVDGFWIRTGEIIGGIGDPLYTSAAVVRDDGTIVAATLDGGIIRSTNAGATWQYSSVGMNQLYVRAIVQFSDGMLIATGDSWMGRSLDNGLTWTTVSGRIPATYGFRALCATPSGALIAVGSQMGMYSSTDRGESWITITNTFWEEDVLATPKGILFAGPNLRRSTDNGATWQILPDSGRMSMSFLCATNSLLLGSNQNDRKAYRSTDDGNSWTKLNTHLIDTVVSALGVDSSGTIFLATKSGLSKSVDQGNSWNACSGFPPNITVNSFASSPNGNVIVCTGNGVYFSNNRGDSWVARANDYHDHSPGNFACASATRILNATKSGVYASDDHGLHWVPSSVGIPISGIHLIAVNPRTGHIVLRTDSTCYRSDDDGSTWIPLGVITIPDYPALLFTPSGTLFMQSNRWTMMQSADEGQTWSLSTFPDNGNQFSETNIIGWKNEVRAGTLHAVYRSLNDGVSWETVPTDASPLPAALDDRGTIYRFGGAASNSLFRSTDAGTSWTEVLPALGYVYADRINVLMSTTGTLFVMRSDGIFRSSDRGSTWQNLGITIADEALVGMCFDRAGYLYVSTNRNIYRSSTPCYWQ